MNGHETCSSQSIEWLLMAFRELRCSSVNHMALQDAKASLLEIQRTMQSQFMTLTIGILALVLTIIQTIIVTISTEIWIWWVSFIIILGTFISLGLCARSNLKTGRKARLHALDQKIESAHDAKNEYSTLKIAAEETLLPVIEVSMKQGEITQERYRVIKKRMEETVSFFEGKIQEKEKELKGLEEDKERLETDC